MKILSIEPTPSPNSMKLNMDEKLPAGERITYTREHKGGCPIYIEKLLDIPHVKSVFHTADFIALDRHPKGNWQHILAGAREIFGEAALSTQDESAIAAASVHDAAAKDKTTSAKSPESAVEQAQSQEAWGEANVAVQTFRGLPIQVRVRSESEEVRLALPERFSQAVMKAHAASPNMIMERKLEEKGVRYGELKEIAEQVVQEIDATYSDERLEQLIAQAYEQESTTSPEAVANSASWDVISRQLDNADWKVRYAALEKLKPTMSVLPLIIKALKDEHSSLRRLAVVYLGDLKEPEVYPYLYEALQDKFVSVRRTAGDCLSDIGEPDAIAPMIKALKDPNKLVRWRAARFLYEAGDETAVEALREAQDDAEFEVSMQVKIALERIEGGAAAEGSVWQQMTRRTT